VEKQGTAVDREPTCVNYPSNIPRGAADSTARASLLSRLVFQHGFHLLRDGLQVEGCPPCIGG
jgi:hypothetical protein